MPITTWRIFTWRWDNTNARSKRCSAILQLAAATGYPRIACLSHLNLAELYILTGDYALASEHGLAGLRQQPGSSI